MKLLEGAGIKGRWMMVVNEKAQEIMDVLYKVYGTDSGILFGINSPKVVGVIIQFTLNYLENNK